MAIAQIKNSFTDIGVIEETISSSSLVLKLTVTNTALRYFVFSQTHHQLIFFGDYTLLSVNNEIELAVRLEKIFEKDEILQLDFASVLIGVDEPYSLVPRELSFLINWAEQQTQQVGETEIVYTPSTLIQQTLKRLFPNSETAHLSSSFLHLLPRYINDSTEKLFVNVSSDHLDIIRFNTDRTLQLMNRYEYKVASDFIYFVLLCCDDLKIDRVKTELILMGEIEAQSDIYLLCHSYFLNIAFIQQPELVHFAKAFENFPKHHYFNLYNLTT